MRGTNSCPDTCTCTPHDSYSTTLTCNQPTSQPTSQLPTYHWTATFNICASDVDCGPIDKVHVGLKCVYAIGSHCCHDIALRSLYRDTE